MKQYLLLLRSSDFQKSGNIWTSNPINLYSNTSYKNYSNKRYAYGLDLIGDKTFVGTEVASPSHSLQHATPYGSNAVYVTNYGEVVYESATPNLLRFIDTSSRIDILSYKHVFTNIPGTFTPTFNIDIFESDDGDVSGPWLKSAIAADSNTLFIRDCKPFVKVQLEIYAPEIDINTLGLIFYLEVGIHDPSSPVISRSGKSILKRFPSWTSLFEDSADSATPELDIPSSAGGKFIAALTQDSLDLMADDVDLLSINAYINSADENALAWIFATYNVPSNVVSIKGDGIDLARVSSIEDFLDSRQTDYVYYHNLFDRKILTVRSFQSLTINDTQFDQEAQNVFNEFDEFGARVSLPRLYLESNLNYKKRILDVNKNVPTIESEGFKRTLRRELDIWRVYGSTPDSDYLGATPEIFEISDIEKSTPYFDDQGRPLDKFRSLVENINSKYPSNMGYVRWEEGVWDYAGLLGEGVGRVPAIYDVDASPFQEYYQGGVGDFEDGKLLLDQVDAATVSFSGSVELQALKQVSSIDDYAPISGVYGWYLKYLKSTPDYEAGGIKDGLGVALVYEVDLPPHDNYTTPSTFYANLNYLDRQDFYVGNRYSQDYSASPEYNYIRIFDQEGLSLDSITFRDKLYDDVYSNTEATPSSSSLSVYDAQQVRVFFNKKWVQASQNFVAIPVSDFRFAFNEATPVYVSQPSSSATANIASPNIDYINSNIRIGSEIYASTPGIFYTDILSSNYTINSLNQTGMGGISNYDIYTEDLVSSIIYPPDATLQALYINCAESTGLDINSSTPNLITSTGGLIEQVYLMPSSPNIEYTFYSGSSPYSSGYSNYFNSIEIDMSSTPAIAATPAFIRLSSNSINGYPFKVPVYESVTVQSTPNIYYGFIDSLNNTYKTSSEVENYYINNDKFLGKIDIDKQTFGLDASTPYLISSIEYKSTPSFIKAWSDGGIDGQPIEQYLTELFNDNQQATVNIYAERDDLSDAYRKLAIHTGWIYVDNNDYYVYSSPKTQNHNGKFFEIKLDETPKLGSPLIVNVNSNPYRNVVFEDSATPGKFSFYNKETVRSTGSESLYLAYENVSNLTVKDTVTGALLFTNIDSSTSTISPFSQATPAIADREYEVIYLVENAYHVEKDEYNSSLDIYESNIYFSSTPSANSAYQIIYEKDYLNKYMEIDLSLDQANNPISEGYVYISKDEYNFDLIQEYLSPKYIGDSLDDLMYLTIVSYDVNGNFKPGQTFRVYGDDITSIPEYITTNDNGLGYSIIQYSGDVPSTKISSSFTIQGIGAATPNGSSNSESDGYIKEVDFVIKKYNNFVMEIKASSVSKNVQADGITTINIAGRVYYHGAPFNHSIVLNWKQANTLYDLFENNSIVNYGSISTNSDGSFIIQGQIVAQTKENPNNWFVAIEVSDPNAVNQIIVSQEENISASDVTITGDIVYWYESYDNVHYANEQLPLNSNFTHVKQQNSELISTPNFLYDHARGQEVIRYSATPSWSIPRWVSLRRFDQYQMGIFGSTPNNIDGFAEVHPDHGEM